jgi:hypothetical protein
LHPCQGSEYVRINVQHYPSVVQQSAATPNPAAKGANGAKVALSSEVLQPWLLSLEDTGIGYRTTIALLRNLGTTQPCATVEIQFIEPPDT